VLSASVSHNEILTYGSAAWTTTTERANVFSILCLKKKKKLHGNIGREGKRWRIRKNEDKRAYCKGRIL